MKSKNSIKLIFLILIISLCSVCFLISCANQKGSLSVTYTFRGVHDFKGKIGQLQKEDLLEGVEVIGSDGKIYIPQIENDIDLISSGKKEIIYSYNGEVTKSYAYIYGEPSFYIDDELKSQDKIDISFKNAFSSNNFTNKIIAKDYFGKPLTVTVKPESDSFDYKVGEYTVVYQAEDCVNQKIETTIIYNVYSENTITVEKNEYEYYVQDNEIEMNCNINSDTCFIMINGNLIDFYDYSFNKSKIVIDSNYLRTLDIKDEFYTVNVFTTEDYTSFKLKIKDNGTPVFDTSAISNAVYYSGKINKLENPTPLIKGHEYNYEFTLIDKDNNSWTTDDILNAGYYTAQIKAINKNDTTKTFTEQCEIKVEITEYTLVEDFIDSNLYSYYANDNIFGNYQVKKYVKTSTSEHSAENNRLIFKLKNNEYDNLKLEFYIDEYSSKNNFDLHCKQYVDKNPIILPVAYVDSYGNLVEKTDIENKKWYTAIFDLSEVKNNEKELEFGIYPSIFDNSSTFTIYYKNDIYADLVNFSDLIGSKEVSFNDICSGVELVSKFTLKNYANFNKTYQVTVNGKKSAWDSRLLISKIAKDGVVGEFTLKQNYLKSLSFDIYYEEIFDKNGNQLTPKELNILNGIHFEDTLNGVTTFKDENGNLVSRENLQIKEWYRVTVNLDGIKVKNDQDNTGINLYLCGSRDNATAKVFIKNVENEEYTDKHFAVFDCQNGTPVIYQYLTDGESAENFIPTKPNDGKLYSFDGWYQGEVKFDFNTQIKTNIILMAKWIERTEEDNDNDVIDDGNINF